MYAGDGAVDGFGFDGFGDGSWATVPPSGLWVVVLFAGGMHTILDVDTILWMVGVG